MRNNYKVHLHMEGMGERGLVTAELTDVHQRSSLSPLSPLCITEGTHAIVRPKPRRPNGRVDQGFSYTNGAPVQPQPVELALTSVATSRPLLQHGKEAALTRHLLQAEKPLVPTNKELSRQNGISGKDRDTSPRPLVLSNKEGCVSPKPVVINGGSPRLVLPNGKENSSSPRPLLPTSKEGAGSPRPGALAKEGYPVEARPRLSLPPPSRISKSQEELDLKTQRSPVLKELKEKKSNGSIGALLSMGTKRSPLQTPDHDVKLVELEEALAGSEESRNLTVKPLPRAPHLRRDVKCAKSLKNVNKNNVRQRLPHRHVSVDELRLLQLRRHEEGSSSDETRSSGHASMSDTLSSSPGVPYRSSLHSVPEDDKVATTAGKSRSKPPPARSRHRATPAKLVPAGSGLEDIKLAIQQLTLKSGGYSTSTYSSQSGSESSEPAVRRLMRHSSLETINTNITAADEFLWVDSHNRLVEVQQLPWSNHCVYRVLASGRTKEICGRVSMDTIPRLSYLLQRALVRISRETQRLARNIGLASKHEVSSALNIVLCPPLADACTKACLRSAAMFAVSGDLTRQSKSSRAGLQFSVGRFHRWMVDVRIAKFIHEYAAIYLAAGMETLLEDIVFQCMPADGEAMLTPTLLEHSIAGNGDLWGLLQPYAHLNAGRIASGALAMDVTASISSETSHSSSSSKSLQENLATTCVGSPGQLRALLNRLVHYQQRTTLTFSLTAINTLYYFMRCSQLEHGQARVQELVYERTYVVLPPLVEWLRVASAHAEHRHSTVVDADDIMQAARLLLPGVDCPVRHAGQDEAGIGSDATRHVKMEAAFKLLSSGRPELIPHAVALLPNSKINSVGESGFSALMLACVHGDMTAARCLLDAGADPDVETPCLPHLETPFWTALCYTVLQANVALARLLLERGAHVEGGWKPSEDRCTLTPLQLAVATGSTEMVSLLLAHGANACLSTLDKDSLCYSGAAQRGSPCAIAVAAAHGQRATLHKLLSHPLATPATKEVLSLEEILAEGSTHERPVASHKPQMKALQEAMYHGCEGGHVELTLELRQLGVAWTLHCWMTTLGTATDARQEAVVDALLQDFVPAWPDDSAQFVDDCLPLLFNIFRYTKKEGTALLLADIFSACYGWEAPRPVAVPSRQPAARIDPTFVNNPELSDVQFRVEGRVLYAHKLVLVTSSARFKNMLSSRLCEGSPPVVQINDIRYSVFQLVMQYLYGGADGLTIPDADVLELMAAANFFQLDGLLQLTEARAAAMVDLDNVVSMYIHAKVYNANQLLEHCQGFLLQNMVALLTYDDSVKRLLFGKKINSHDVLAGLMGTLQSRIKQRNRVKPA